MDCRRICIVLLQAGLLLAVGCRSPLAWRQQADKAAAEEIARAQGELGKTVEAIEVERPADTLRRRLLLDQQLPHVGVESLGIHDLPENRFWDPQAHGVEQAAALGNAAADGDSMEPLRPTLLEALQISAANNPAFQSAKEDVFRAALDLDLERDSFRNTFAGVLSEGLESSHTGEQRRTGVTQTATGEISRKFKSGAQFSSAVALDLVKLLTQSRSSSLGVHADASISIPLLRGAGRDIAAEPLTQAERNMLYAINGFERFKQTFAVAVATDYFSVLQQYQQVQNESENYKRVIASTRRARRLADSGRLPEFQFDQAIQDELRARNRWISARQSYERDLDRLKQRLGLPVDARLEVQLEELQRLGTRAAEFSAGVDMADYSGQVPPADAEVDLQEPSNQGAGPLELVAEDAIGLALAHRADLHSAVGRVGDAQRRVMIAADRLRGELTLLGRAAVGEGRSLSQADLPNGTFYPDEGRFSALLNLDLPLERTAERNSYRDSLIRLQRAVRDLQELEDTVKLAVRNRLRSLLEARESVSIQSQAVRLAEKRVKSTNMFLQAGRAAIRDLLEAQDALLSAQNALNSALVSYRIGELSLQQDLGVLEVTVDGLWREFVPRGRE